jgi:hypothetical protein
MSRKYPKLREVILPVAQGNFSGEYNDRKEFTAKPRKGPNFQKPKRKKR